jgi:hypothetical protein
MNDKSMSNDDNALTLRWGRKNPPVDSEVYDHTTALVRVADEGARFGWVYFLATLVCTPTGWGLIHENRVWDCLDVEWIWLG